MEFPKDISKDLKELLYETYTSTELFCKTFMPETFTKPFSSGHKRVFDILDDNSIQKAVIALPRGWGKTSIINKAYPAKKIVFRDTHYMVTISSTGSSAIEFSENLKNELINNEALTRIFGSIKSNRMRGGGDPFSTLEWVTSTGIKIMPRGAGQQIRGRQFKNHRPDLYIADDLEDDEAVESEERRRKLAKWFLSAVSNSVDFASDDWRIIVIGTLLHEDSLLANLLDERKHPDWVKLKLELCDDNCVSNWPEHMSDEKCRALYNEYKAAEQSDIFFREFRNIPIAIDSQGFKQSYFQYYEEPETFLNNDPDWETVILADPAKTMKVGSANTAIVGISINTKLNKLYIRDVVEEKLNPDEILNGMLDMALRLDAIIIAPEVTSLNEYILHPLRNAIQERGLYYTIIEVKPRQAKTGSKRSAGLIPLYRRGQVYHNKTACMGVEKYLLQWPRPTKWDVIDAIAGIIFVMEEGARYFRNMDEDPNEIEAEYKELRNEPPLDLPVLC